MSYVARRQPISLDKPHPLCEGAELLWNLDEEVRLEYQGFGVWGLRRVGTNQLAGTLTTMSATTMVMETGTDDRLDNYFCTKHGFIPVGETFKFADSDDLYCLACLREWGPRALPKIKRGIKPVE